MVTRGAGCSPVLGPHLCVLMGVLVPDDVEGQGGHGRWSPRWGCRALEGRPTGPSVEAVASAALGAWGQVDGVQVLDGGDGWDSVNTDSSLARGSSGKLSAGLVDQMAGERSAGRPRCRGTEQARQADLAPFLDVVPRCAAG